MNIILIIGLVQSLLLFLLIITKKKKQTHDYFLSLYLFYSAINFGYFYLHINRLLMDFPMVDFLGKGFIFLEGPFFYFYLQSFLNKTTKSTSWYVFQSISFILFLCFLAYFSQIKESAVITSQFDLIYFDGKLSISFLFIYVLMIAIYPIYLFLYYKVIFSAKFQLQDSLSYTEDVNLKWLILVFYISVSSTFLLYVSYILYNFFETYSYYNYSYISYSLYTISIFLLGFFGFKYTYNFSEINPEESTVNKPSYKKSGLNKKDSKELHLKLLDYMRKEKPHIDGELSLRSLAEKLNISPNYLSQVINENNDINFFEFINVYRVEEVKAKMKDPNCSHYTILALAIESGFRSKTSFNKIFKANTGITPSVYQKNNSF